MTKYTIIYMAAGNSRRFGSENKLLKEFEGKPLYRHGLDLLLEVTAEKENVDLIVITQYSEILEETEKYRLSGNGNFPADGLAETGRAGRSSRKRQISCFLNPDSRKGVSYTIHRGVQEALAAGPVDYFLFVTADQPFLSAHTVKQFLRIGECQPQPEEMKKPEGINSEAGGIRCRYPVASAAYGERLGNPVMFRSDLAEELMKLEGDEGGRKVWRRYARQGILVQVRDRRDLQDMDVWEDMKNISTE